MSKFLEVRLINRRLRFHPDFTVEAMAADAGEAVGKEGTWESFSGENENELSFKFDDEPRTSLAAEYRFNDDNQLVAQIPKQAGVAADSAEWTLPGQIAIDDNRDLIYTLLDDDGKISTRKMYVYAELSFLEGTDRMTVKFADGRKTAIVGSDGVSSLRAEDYIQGGDLARDLLKFQAETINEVGGSERSVPAIIQFVGRWDLQADRLVLVTEMEIGDGKPKGVIAIGGRYKGTNVGLLVEGDGAFALQVNGTYSWNQSSLTWGLRLGHTPGNTLEGELKVNGKIQGKNGTLKIQGDLSLSGKSGGLKLDFALEVSYEAKDHSLFFKIAGSQGSYNINFGGTIKINDRRVTFSISASSSGSLEADFGFYQKKPNLEMALQVMLSKKGLALKATMKFRVVWGPGGLLEPVTA